MELNVTAKVEENLLPADRDALVRAITGGGEDPMNRKFADISLYVNGEQVTTSGVLFGIPVKMGSNTCFGVSRLHDGVARKFEEIRDAAAATDGTYLVGDGMITLYSANFSLYAITSEPAVRVRLPAAVEGVLFVVSNLTGSAAAEILPVASAAGGAVYMLPIGAKVSVTAVSQEGYRLKSGAEATLVIDPVSADAADVQSLLDAALAGWEIVPSCSRLYPKGDGAFKPAEKTTATYYGTLVGTNGVEGTITVKMTKPNRKGLFNISATVKTLVDKQSYSFKATKVTAADGVAAEHGALTFALVGSNRKSKAHLLAVTLGGDSLTGAFDDSMIDGARHVFWTSRDPKRTAVLPYVGTWTGTFADAADTNGLSVTSFSAKLTKSGSASVRVYFADGKTASCSAKAEVGADIVAVPVTLQRRVEHSKRSLGFRLVFGAAADGNAVCEVTDLTPVRDWTKNSGATVVVSDLQFLMAGLQTVTAKDFKSYVVMVDPALTTAFGPISKSSLKLLASTGRITGSLWWKVPYVDARGRERTKNVSGSAKGIIVNGRGFGTVTVKLGKEKESFAFTALPAADMAQ